MIILSLTMVSSIVKVGKSRERPLTSVFTTIKAEKTITLFVTNFIYMYFPTLDFFVSKLILSKVGCSSANFYLLKFPSIIEADLLLSSIEDLLSIYSLTRISFTLSFTTNHNRLDYLAYSHFNRLPVLL
jgi:hypothetical protein